MLLRHLARQALRFRGAQNPANSLCMLPRSVWRWRGRGGAGGLSSPWSLGWQSSRSLIWMPQRDCQELPQGRRVESPLVEVVTKDGARHIYERGQALKMVQRKRLTLFEVGQRSAAGDEGESDNVTLHCETPREGTPVSMCRVSDRVLIRKYQELNNQLTGSRQRKKKSLRIWAWSDDHDVRRVAEQAVKLARKGHETAVEVRAKGYVDDDTLLVARKVGRTAHNIVAETGLKVSALREKSLPYRFVLSAVVPVLDESNMTPKQQRIYSSMQELVAQLEETEM